MAHLEEKLVPEVEIEIPSQDGRCMMTEMIPGSPLMLSARDVHNGMDWPYVESLFKIRNRSRDPSVVSIGARSVRLVKAL
jgi:hypothetical protein